MPAAPPAEPARPLAWLDDLTLAVIFLTRVPLRLRHPPAPDGLARAMGWFPLVGAAAGAAGGGVYALAALANLPPPVAALLAVAAMVWLTGALHEDGLADVADGFGGGRDRERKLEIMRDSRVGTYGAAALVLTLGLRVAALAALAGPGAVTAALAAAGACSRAAVPVVARTLAPARRDGLAATQANPTAGRVVLALALAAGVTLATAGAAAPAAWAGAALAAAAVAGLALRQIGGYTGDVLGAVQQAAEIAVLLVLVALR
ncbi:adenosylcobinamide-GDP ribazoletransferase [Azospirillum halopraeferens]|uniref:adenosylcobinamide-GDP ribazoletransferase n=1 Tax=Azospirillum halopraeferens TaxID=34010 RepID=UPI0003F6962E|nr:adenosylcobinamide-GDP ribazoletransferase [Azospirillum halopraeferens]